MADISRIARYSLEMDAPLSTQPIVGILQRTDKKADTIQVNLKQGGQTVSLTGATAAAYFKRPVDGAQVRCVGTVNGGAITVQLADQCYKNAGPFELLLKLVSGGVERTILRLTGYVEAGGDGAIVDPTGSIPSYDELEAAVAAATAAAETANTAAENADAKAQAAETAAGSANSAAQAANAAAGKIDGLTVAASGLAPGAAPTAVASEVDGHKHIAFGIPKGEKGNTGVTPNIQIGTVSTGNPGTDAAASMGGTAENPMLNLTIPRGADGSGSVSTVDGVEPSGGDVPLGAVRYNAAQSLAEAQQAQARENMNAAKNAAMTGATASAAGAGGLVPAPAAGDEKKALLGDGTWGSVASSGGIYVGDTAPTDENINAWMDTSEDVSGYSISELMQMAHPVGSIYQSTMDTSPQMLFGGTWERLKDRFLLAAGDTYEAGAIGGEATHTLTVDEMPAHQHNITTLPSNEAGAEWAGASGKSAVRAQSTTIVGGGAAHNNMPPYIAVYAWKRTA